MITGVVTADRQATIRLAVRGPAGDELAIEAAIDTGFNGWLSLPPSSISQPGLPWRQRARALLADCVRIVLKNGLALLGISAPTSM